jgi:phosphoesterase RecJ-like protein
VVYEVLLALRGEISAEEATLLYVALTTDTGCFVYANVTAHTFTVAGELLRAGAAYRQVNKKLFRTKARGRMALDGALLSDLRFYHGGRVAVVVVTLDLLARLGVTEDDLDDIASIPNLAEGVLVGIVVKELEQGGCKVSVRSSSEVDANRVCQTFGGGGHPMAAGCTIDLPPEETAKLLVAAAGDALG